jgi:hypothetical protein
MLTKITKFNVLHCVCASTKRQNRFSAAPINPHFVVPAIPSAPPPPPSPPIPDRLRDAVGDKTGINTQLVGTQLEPFAFPPRRFGAAAALEPWEEDRLRYRVQEDLGNFRDGRTHLKDVYVELTGFDRRLTGNVSFADLGFAFNRCNVRFAFSFCFITVVC